MSAGEEIQSASFRVLLVMSDNLAVLETALRHFASPESRERYFDLYDPDIVLYGYAGVEPGIANVKAFYQALWKAFPDAVVGLEDAFAAGEKVVCRFVLRATHRGDFMGIAPTNREIRLPGITILRFLNGKCVERWSQADFLGLMQQLGVQA